MTNREIFDLVLHLGEVTLVNGGEISRTKATLERVAAVYGIREFSTYIISNGIFMTGVMGEGQNFCTKVTDVPLSPVCLCRVEAANDLSRAIVSQKIPPEEAQKRLEAISTMAGYPPWVETLATGVGSGCFGYLMGGTLLDCFMVFFFGMFLSLFLLFLRRFFQLPKIMRNLFSGAFVTVLCCSAVALGWGSTLDGMIIGSIMPLVPGIPLTNAVRYFFDDDYLSGVVRMVDALLVALSVATGVGVVLLLWNTASGGMIL